MAAPVIPEACETAWREGAHGWTQINRDARIIASSTPAIVGRSWAELGADKVYGEDLAHVFRFGRPLRVRRLWHRRVWESTFALAGEQVVLTWRVVLEIPDDAFESTSRWSDAVHSVLEALEGGDPDAAYVPAATAARRSARAPVLRVV